eukprot:PhM_4_TR2087/c4_g1_i9/m.91430
MTAATFELRTTARRVPRTISRSSIGGMMVHSACAGACSMMALMIRESMSSPGLAPAKSCWQSASSQASLSSRSSRNVGHILSVQFGGCTIEEQADVSFGPFRTLAAFCEFCCPSFLLDCGQRLPLGVYHCHVAVFRELHFVQRCLCPRWSCGCFTLMPMLLMSSSVMCLVGRSASTTTWSGVAWCCCRACISPIVSSSLELEASPSGIWAPAPPAGSQLNCRNVCEMCGLALTSVWLCVSVMPDLFMAISSVRQAAKVNSCAVLCTCGGRFVWATIMLMRITWRPHSLDDTVGRSPSESGG